MSFPFSSSTEWKKRKAREKNTPEEMMKKKGKINEFHSSTATASFQSYTLLSAHTRHTPERASQVTLSRTVKIIHFIFFVSSFFPHSRPTPTKNIDFTRLSTAAYKLSVLSACALLAFFSVLFFSSLLMIRFSPCCVQSAFNLWWMNIVKLEESVVFPPPHTKKRENISVFIFQTLGCSVRSVLCSFGCK